MTLTTVKNTTFVQVFEAEYNHDDYLHQLALPVLEKYVRCEESQKRIVADIAYEATQIMEGHDFLRGDTPFSSEARKLSNLLAEQRILNEQLAHFKHLMSEGE